MTRHPRYCCCACGAYIIGIHKWSLKVREKMFAKSVPCFIGNFITCCIKSAIRTCTHPATLVSDLKKKKMPPPLCLLVGVPWIAVAVLLHTYAIRWWKNHGKLASLALCRSFWAAVADAEESALVSTVLLLPSLRFACHGWAVLCRLQKKEERMHADAERRASVYYCTSLIVLINTSGWIPEWSKA